MISQMEYERTHAAAIITEKRGKNFDKVLGEWKAKADDLMAELEACRCESRNYSSEVFRLKAACDESMEQLDVVKRENKVDFFTFLPIHIVKLTLTFFRISLMRSRTYLTSLVTVAGPYMSWTSRGGGWRWRRRSCRGLWRRRKVLWSRRRTR